MAGERTRWNEDENKRLETVALPLLIANPKMTIIEAVRQVADTVLPPDRRRNLVNVGALPVTLRTSLEMKRKAALGKADLVPAEALKEAEEQRQIQQIRADALQEKINELEAEVKSLEATIRTYESIKIPEPMDVLKQFCTDVLANAIAKTRAIPGGPEPTSIVPPKVNAEIIKKHNGEQQPSGIRKPKVALVGASPQRALELQRMFSNTLDLRYFDAHDIRRISDSMQAFRDKTHGKVIVWTNYCGHQVYGSLDSKNIPYERFKGEITSMKIRLQKIVDGH